MTAEELIAFEKDIAREFESGHIQKEADYENHLITGKYMLPGKMNKTRQPEIVLKENKFFRKSLFSYYLKFLNSFSNIRHIFEKSI